tara:strand:+ start:976 stop:1323 length:348 start_codon:yes stop_codon:yes gene_type:complete
MSSFSDLMGRIIGGDTGIVREGSTEIASFDLAGVLAEKEKANAEDLDWKRSIADLMTLVNMDTSYGSRKELALELGYRQIDIDRKGSSEMNIWLHQEVMKRLAENGGQLPEGLIG